MLGLDNYKNMKKIITKFGILGVILLPLMTFAAGKDLEYIIKLIIKYFNYAIQLTIALAVVMFVWNVYKYFIAGADDVGKKKEAGLYVMWSIIGFFVILSVWGLVNILMNSFNLDNDQPSSGFFGKFNPLGDPFNGAPTGGTSNQGGTGGTSNPGGTGGTSNPGN